MNSTVPVNLGNKDPSALGEEISGNEDGSNKSFYPVYIKVIIGKY